MTSNYLTGEWDKKIQSLLFKNRKNPELPNMITYSLEPIPMADASKIKAWLATREAQLFRECVNAQMNELYCDAINAQSKPADTVNDFEKFNLQAQESLNRAGKILNFLRVFDEFADSGYGFHKLKINV